ncbi:MAG: 16S rRNA (guanine(966)-N(2))-methyltransferase RsmD [Elusimicrobiota bacterium]
MVLRITSGTYKNRVLASIPGKGFRPLSERMKLALFSAIGDKIHGVRFLDLFAGTGNVGLEALSRGAASVTFVEQYRDKIDLIKRNTDFIGKPEEITIIQSDVLSFHTEEEYDIIFAGPPYKANIGTEILSHLRDSKIMSSGVVLILQRHYRERPDTAGYTGIRSSRYGITCLDFLKLDS